MENEPQKLGKYVIRHEVGRGAMGVVYEGWDPSIGRRVALKTIRRDQLDSAEAQEMLDRFKREAQAAGRLNHPNSVSVYEYGEDDGMAFIAMEFIEGRELKNCFDQCERFAVADIVNLMSQVLAALGAAHAQGIVHRDVKPSNIFVLPDGRAKVTDFGIARLESSNLTQVGSVLGTPAYMSPEQLTGQIADHRSDLYSAGIILYQFLAGEKPYCGNFAVILHKALHDKPIPPSRLNVHVPPIFDAIVYKALAKSPDQRFQSAQAFANALQEALAAPVADTEATLINVAAPAGHPDLPAAAKSPVVAEAAAPPGAAAPRKRTAVWLAGALGGVAALIAGALLLRPLPAGTDSPAAQPVAAPSAAQMPGNEPRKSADKASPPASAPVAAVSRPAVDKTRPSKTPVAAAGPAAPAEPRPVKEKVAASPATAACPTCNCPDLMTKLSIGVESLTPAQREYFRQNCR